MTDHVLKAGGAAIFYLSSPSIPGYRFECHPETKTIFCVKLATGYAHHFFNKWDGNEMTARIIVDVFISGWHARGNHDAEK